MNALPLFSRALGESWRALLGWTLGIAATVLLYIPLYPSMKSESMQALMDSLPKELVNTLGYSLATGAGYVESTYFGLMGFLLLSIAAIAWGTAAVAGDEESGGLELTLAHGVSRTRVVLERTAAVLVRLLALGLVGSLFILALNDAAELGLDGGNLVAVTAALVGLAMLAAAAAIAVGALGGRRSWALAAGTAVPVLGYAINAVANQSADLDGLHAWSPYAWAFGNTPLADGADWGGLGLLYGFSALLVFVAVVALNRRDVGV
jgi:ABC-2 type transport system permease protein